MNIIGSPPGTTPALAAQASAGSAPAVAASPAPKSATPPADGVSVAAAGAAAPVASLAGDGPPVDLRTVLRGFAQGTPVSLKPAGLGSLFAGGDGRVVTLSAGTLHLEMHVHYPGGRSDSPMHFAWDGSRYVSARGPNGEPPQHYRAALSNGGRAVTFTNQDHAGQRVVLAVPQSGKLEITSYGFGHDGQTLVATASR